MLYNDNVIYFQILVKLLPLGTEEKQLSSLKIFFFWTILSYMHFYNHTIFKVCDLIPLNTVNFLFRCNSNSWK